MRAPAALSIAFSALALGCTVPVAAALDEPDANRVVVALDQAGIAAEKEADPQAEGKFKVMVPRDDAARALTTMRDEELPRAKTKGLPDATDRGQLVPSQAAEHAQLVAGLAGDLERSLLGVDGVLAARVHLNLPPRDALRDAPQPKATASVLLEHRGTTPPLAAESIQRLVAGGAPGLSPNDVAVVFTSRASRPGAGAARADLAHVGPITVARSSVLTLKGALAALVVLVLGFAAATLALYTRLSKLIRDREAQPAGLPPRPPARPQ